MIINNKKNSLLNLIPTFCNQSDKAYFLVGYFYFSGYVSIYQSLEDLHLQILVGLDIERDIVNTVKEFEVIATPSKVGISQQSMKDSYYEHFVDVFNNTALYDTKVQREAFQSFLNKICNDTLEIRKTDEPCHAKMYIFQNKTDFHEGTDPGNVIIGSSNLSLNGFRDQYEINVLLKEKSDYEDGKQIFENLWDKAVPLVDIDTKEEFYKKVIDKIWLNKTYDPFLIYLKVLDEYFSIDSKKRLKTAHEISSKYYDLMYQNDAVRIAIDAIEKYNGVIIADVVGLGKSIIASTIANNLSLRTFIISPPHLMDQWNDYSMNFRFNGMVYSCGLIKNALDQMLRLEEENEEFLIIIDEAHRYRNEFTQDYALLKNLCLGNKVVLLSATPYNNSPEDIYNLIKLFQIPSNPSLNTENDLGNTFNILIKRYRNAERLIKKHDVEKTMEINIELEEIAAEIRRIIDPLVVRRSRIDLASIDAYKKDLKRQKITFPIIKDPISLEYDLGKLEQIYFSTLELISPKKDNSDQTPYYKATRYQPIRYVKKEKLNILKKELEANGYDYGLLVGTQINLSSFMRRLLVRRFESSIDAFRKSINNMIAITENILNWKKLRGVVPIYREGLLPLIGIYEETSDDSIELDSKIDKYKEKGLFELNVDYLEPMFFDDVISDLNILKQIQTQWQTLELYYEVPDPKFDFFKKQLKMSIKKDPTRKMIVFSEFSDTADYLTKKLQESGFRVFEYTSQVATSQSKNIIRANFDAGASKESQKNDFDILVATDAIAEGYSLHRAGSIYNYDIPYNPTKVIQRVGRINRINKQVFDELYIYNFFPTVLGESETKTKEISTLKIAMIQYIFGDDTKVLTEDESLNSYFLEQYKKVLKTQEAESWETKHRQCWMEYKDSELMIKANEIPFRTRIARASSKFSGILVFGKKGNDYIFKNIGYQNAKIDILSQEEALELFKSEIDEQPVKISENFDSYYETVTKELFLNSNIDGKKNDLQMEVFRKIQCLIKLFPQFRVYLNDLAEVVKINGISGYDLREIKKMQCNDAKKLPELVSQRYLHKVLSQAKTIEEGHETVILSEELQGSNE